MWNVVFSMRLSKHQPSLCTETCLRTAHPLNCVSCPVFEWKLLSFGRVTLTLYVATCLVSRLFSLSDAQVWSLLAALHNIDSVAPLMYSSSMLHYTNSQLYTNHCHVASVTSVQRLNTVLERCPSLTVIDKSLLYKC